MQGKKPFQPITAKSKHANLAELLLTLISLLYQLQEMFSSLLNVIRITMTNGIEVWISLHPRPELG